VIEICVALALLSILAAILLPVMMGARATSEKASCGARLAQIGVALQIYARDHDGRLPPRHHDLRPLLPHYLDDPLLFFCPTDALRPTSDPEELRQRWTGTSGGPPVSGYQYRGGLLTDERSDIPVAGDWEAIHSDSVNVLYLSGRVRTVRALACPPIAPGPRAFPATLPSAKRSIPIPYLNPGHKQERSRPGSKQAGPEAEE
jgi:type II secretory pathway pseudopilin PulG